MIRSSSCSALRSRPDPDAGCGPALLVRPVHRQCRQRTAAVRLVPWFGKLLRWWLTPAGARDWRRDVADAGLMLGVYAAWLLVFSLMSKRAADVSWPSFATSARLRSRKTRCGRCALYWSAVGSLRTMASGAVEGRISPSRTFAYIPSYSAPDIRNTTAVPETGPRPGHLPAEAIPGRHHPRRLSRRARLTAETNYGGSAVGTRREV